MLPYRIRAWFETRLRRCSPRTVSHEVRPPAVLGEEPSRRAQREREGASKHSHAGGVPGQEGTQWRNAVDQTEARTTQQGQQRLVVGEQRVDATEGTSGDGGLAA